MGVLSTVKKYTKGLTTEQGTFNLLSHDIDFQFKNQWECLISRPNAITGSILHPSTISIDPLAVGGELLDTAIARVFLYSITIPSYGYEYKKVEGTSYVSSAVYPESVTMTFLEDVYGLTRRWIQYWMSRVAAPYEFNYSADPTTNNKTYWGRVFNENQLGAKRDATILLSGWGGIPFYPQINLMGLRPQSVEEVTVGHEEHEDLRISLVCSIDEIKVPWLI